MNVLAVMTLVLLQLSPVKGPRMAYGTVFGIRLDMLRHEAQLVLGRQRAVLEVAPNEKSPVAPAAASARQPAVVAKFDWRNGSNIMPAVDVPWIEGGDARGYLIPTLASLSPQSFANRRPVRFSAMAGVARDQNRAMAGQGLFESLSPFPVH